METGEPGKRVEIIINESDRWRNKPLWTAILELLRREGATGATVTRGMAGFAGHRLIHSATADHFSTELPVVLAWVDSPSHVERLLPKLREILQGGSVTVQDVEWYRAIRTKDPVIAGDILVRDVMTRQVASVGPQMTVEELAQLLAGKRYHGMPVVNPEGEVVGVVTTTDLAERGSLDSGAGLRAGLLVGDIMSKVVGSVSPDATLPEAARVMASRGHRRLPVVEGKRLVGLISRFDLLRTVSTTLEDTSQEPSLGGISALTPISQVMRRNVPTVLEDDSLRAVVNRVGSSKMQLAVVLDEWRHVVGLITDAELVERLTPAEDAQTPGHTHDERGEAHHLRAKDIMKPDVETVFGDTPVGQALKTMMDAGQKVLPVVDNAWRLEGMVDRTDLLGWLAVPAGGREERGESSQAARRREDLGSL